MHLPGRVRPARPLLCRADARVPEKACLEVERDGRGGGSALRSVMDTVSEIKDVEHAYRAGIQARKGVDY